MPYTILGYHNGPGWMYHRLEDGEAINRNVSGIPVPITRRNVSEDDTGMCSTLRDLYPVTDWSVLSKAAARSLEAVYQNCRIAQKYDRRLDVNAVETSVKYQRQHNNDEAVVATPYDVMILLCQDRFDMMVTYLLSYI